jgi:hypothetical protein
MKEATLTAYPSMQEWVLNTLQEHGVCSLDELGALLPGTNWSQLFRAIDRLSRGGAIGLRSLGNGEYLLNLKDPDCS